MTNANENPRGLPVVSPWDVLDAATRGEEWVTFGELKRAREQLATDLAAAMARAEAAEALLREVTEWISGWEPPFVDDPEWQPVADRIDAAIAAQRSEPEPEPERYVCLKATGSRYAYVNDTQAGKTVERYDIFRRYGGRDGWTCASEHAASLNAIAAQQAEGEA